RQPTRPPSCNVAPSPGSRISKISSPMIRVCCDMTLDLHKLHAITRLEQEHRLIQAVRSAARRVEDFQRRVTDDVPAAWTVHSVNARVFSADSDRAGAHFGSGRRQAQCVQTRVQITKVRKSGRETEHV